MRASLPVFDAAIGHLAAYIAPATSLQIDPGSAAGVFSLPADGWDLVILNGCLEQLPKSSGIDLLNALVYRSAWLLVVASEFVVRDTGVHVSAWSERDFAWHDLWAWDNCRATTLAVMRGYRSAPLTLAGLVDHVNQSAIPVRDFDGQAFVRPARLRLVELLREVNYRPA